MSTYQEIDQLRTQTQDGNDVTIPKNKRTVTFLDLNKTLLFGMVS